MAEIKIEQSTGAQVVIEGVIPADQFSREEKLVLEALNRETKLDGFRPGHIPEAVLRREVGEDKILNEMAERALQAEYPKILAEHKIDAIGLPQITITKMARGENLGFKIVTDIIPEITLPDWQPAVKKVGEGEPAEVVTDEEVSKVIGELLASRAKEGEKEPELTDETASQFGESKTAQELKEQIKKNLTQEKAKRANDKWRLNLIEAVLAETPFETPKTLTEAEIDKMLAELRDNIERMGMKFEDYLTHLKKSEQDLRAAWQADAEKRVKVGLVMNELARAANLKPDDEQVKKEAEHLKSYYPDVEEKRIQAYVAHVLTMEKVWEQLESAAKKV